LTNLELFSLVNQGISMACFLGRSQPILLALLVVRGDDCRWTRSRYCRQYKIVVLYWKIRLL